MNIFSYTDVHKSLIVVSATWTLSMPARLCLRIEQLKPNESLTKIPNIHSVLSIIIGKNIIFNFLGVVIEHVVFITHHIIIINHGVRNIFIKMWKCAFRLEKNSTKTRNFIRDKTFFRRFYSTWSGSGCVTCFHESS